MPSTVTRLGVLLSQARAAHEVPTGRVLCRDRTSTGGHAIVHFKPV